jgi:hypothetical protein
LQIWKLSQHLSYQDVFIWSQLDSRTQLRNGPECIGWSCPPCTPTSARSRPPTSMMMGALSCWQGEAMGWVWIRMTLHLETGSLGVVPSTAGAIPIKEFACLVNAS